MCPSLTAATWPGGSRRRLLPRDIGLPSSSVTNDGEETLAVLARRLRVHPLLQRLTVLLLELCGRTSAALLRSLWARTSALRIAMSEGARQTRQQRMRRVSAVPMPYCQCK